MMSRKKIVIIDDEEDLCHLMKTYFLELNHDVFLANTLQPAFRNFYYPAEAAGPDAARAG